MSDFPPPFDPPSLTVPYPPPEVGEGSPWAPADAENRDRILDWWRAWWRRVFFPWLASFINALNTWLEAAEAYIIAHAIAGYSIRLTADALNPTGTTDVEITLGEDIEFRPLVVGDVVLDQTIDSRFGIITVVIDATHATVQTQGSVKGTDGHGWWVTATPIAHAGTTDVILTAESDRTVQLSDLVVDESTSSAYGIVTVITDPTHVTVTFINTLQGDQGPQGIPGPQGDPGVVQSIVAGDNITVDDTDPANPVVSGAAGSGVVDSVVAGDNITVDNTDPANPIVSATGGGVGSVASVVAGTSVLVDNADPANPVVSLDQTKTLPSYANEAAFPDPALYPGQLIYNEADTWVWGSDGTSWFTYQPAGGGGTVVSVTATQAPYNVDTPVNFTGTSTDPVLEFNLIETDNGSGYTSEFGGPATNLRVQADDSTGTGRIKVQPNYIELTSFLDSDGSGPSLTVNVESTSGEPGTVVVEAALLNLAVLSADPAGIWTQGAIYYSSTTHAIRVYDGAAWS